MVGLFQNSIVYLCYIMLLLGKKVAPKSDQKENEKLMTCETKCYSSTHFSVSNSHQHNTGESRREIIGTGNREI